MYEDKTAKEIENEMLDTIDTLVYDKRVGSLIQTDLAATAIEIAKDYEIHDYINDQISPLTSDREHLEGWGDVFDIHPLQATYAIVQATIEMAEGYQCPIGSRFSWTNLNYVVITHDGGTNYTLQCETAGEIGNTAYGRIIPIFNIPGLLSAYITGTAILGSDVESDDSLRQRLIDKFRERPYGWNMAEYKQNLAMIQGVGGFKVVRYFKEEDWCVGVYIIDTEYKAANKALVDNVQEILHPLLPDYSEPVITNSGDGLVAIGHKVFVMSATEVVIDIKLHVDLAKETEYETIEPQIQEAIDLYLREGCNKNWGDGDQITVRISRIENVILDIEGVIDIYDTELNGEQANLVLEPYEVTKLGTITRVVD